MEKQSRGPLPGHPVASLQTGGRIPLEGPVTVPALPPAGDLLILSATGDATRRRIPADREVDAPAPPTAAFLVPARVRH